MTDAPAPKSTREDESHIPEAEAASAHGFNWIWLVPIAALGLVGYLMYSLVRDRGPMIQVTFETADGLSANQTPVKYRAVTLGTVEEIKLSADRSHVVVSIRTTDQAEPLLTENARFWVVKPRLSGGLRAFQTGLETLVSGVYVAMDPGAKGGAPQQHFEGLEAPPSVRSDEPGTVYFLEADALGGLGRGAPVIYRDVEVGEVLSHKLTDGGVVVRIFVRAPYDENVVSSTRFWNTSGLRLGTGAEGLRLELASVQSLLSGGIGFHTPRKERDQPPSPAESRFHLYESKDAAETGFYSVSFPYISYFQSSVRGLAEGTEVHMFGRRLGSVTSVRLARDPRPGQAGQFAVRVEYVLQPERALDTSVRSALDATSISELVGDGLRVVLKTSNLLTSEKVLSLEYVPGAEATLPLEREGDTPVLPGDTQDLRQIAATISEVVNNIERVPFERIGENLDRTLSSIERTVSAPELRNAIVSLDATLREAHGLAREARAGLHPVLEKLPHISDKLEHAVERADAAFGRNGYGADSDVQRNIERMMQQVASAARSIRVLADFLNRHPEALVTGRAETRR